MMFKQIVVYKEKDGKIAKFVDGVEIVDGEVVNNEHENGCGFWESIFSFFSARTEGNPDTNHRYNPAPEYTAEQGSEKEGTWMPPQVIIEGYGDERSNDGTY
jgi:hypothetical protein